MFSQALWQVRLCLFFRRDPSAFANVHDSGPSGWARTSFMFTLILSELFTLILAEFPGWWIIV